LNQTANIEFYGLPFGDWDDFSIKRDGADCPGEICNVITSDVGIAEQSERIETTVY